MIRLNLVRPKQFAAIEFTRQDLIQIGAKAIDSITKRVALGIDANDRPAKRLSAGYRRKKTAKGQPGIRNLMYSGSMLGSMTITEATNNRVVIGFNRRSELIKAQTNQARDPWFGLSSNDEAKTLLFADQLLARKARK